MWVSNIEPDGFQRNPVPLPSVKCRFLARAQEDSLSRTFVNPLASLGICERLYTIRKEKARVRKLRNPIAWHPRLRSTSLPYKVRKESSARKKKARDVNTCQHHIATSKSPSRCTSLGPHGKKHIAERYRKKIDGRKNSLRLKLSFFSWTVCWGIRWRTSKTAISRQCDVVSHLPNEMGLVTAAATTHDFEEKRDAHMKEAKKKRYVKEGQWLP